MRQTTETATVYVEASDAQDIIDSVVRDDDSDVVAHADNWESWVSDTHSARIVCLDRLEDNNVLRNVVLKLPARKK